MLTSKTPSVIIPIEGMHCASCAQKIETSLKGVPGVSGASVNFASKKALVTGDVPIEVLFQAIETVGYKPLRGKVKNKELELKLKQQQMRELGIAAACSLPLLIISMAMLEFPGHRWAQAILSLPVLWVGRGFFIRAWKLLVRYSANMDTLVALGTGAAFLSSFYALLDPGQPLYFEAAAVVITLILLGRYLEEKAQGRTNETLMKLMNLAPKETWILEEGDSLATEKRGSVSSLKAGQKFVARPGESIATDGIVIEGESSVNEAMVTGESLPVEKQKGTKVIGGTLNLNGRLVVQATSIGENTMLAQIIQWVEEAQGSKAPIQKMADQISAVFVPIVLVISLLTLLGWLTTGHSFMEALLPSVAVLVIACPCALGLATPTAIITGMGRAASLGILIRDARSLEEACRLQVLLFDKTGTLTQGEPQVVDCVNYTDSDSALSYVASVEQASSHPLAQAIVNFGRAKGVQFFPVGRFKNIPGSGTTGEVEGHEVRVGSLALFEKNMSPEKKIMEETSHFASEGKTTVLATVDGKPAFLFAITDPIKTNAKSAIQHLKRNHELVLVTGDNLGAGNALAKTLGISRVLAGASPQQKAEEVQRLQKEGLKVGMIGDGINDAPALALADVSFAIGTGTDIAKEAASITLIKGDIAKLATALEVSSQTVRIIKQNLFASFFYNVLSIPLAMLGLLNPMVAGLAMALSSVSVVLNSLRLKRFKPRQ